MDLHEVAEYKPRLADYRDIARVHICVPDIKTQATIPHLIAAGSCLVLADALMTEERSKMLLPLSARLVTMQ